MTVSPLIVLERAVDVHRRLDRAGIRHAIGGALALAYHVSQARATNDIDLNVSADPKKPQRVFDVLPDDVPWTKADVATVRSDGQVRLRWPVPDAGPPIPLDLFFPQHALHDAIDSRAELVPMLDASVPILSATDLLVFKALFDRRKDWADIEELLRFGKVDVAEAGSWLEEIVGGADRRLGKLAEIVAEVGGGGCR
ncbi:MAG: hypothetical protein JO246_05895 [Frankiaceae bacterium]|nr:hypothetical protein [Frankiaceae bacterium]MBV9872954.1 hypothetical protein [Frankiaceae bacterium]